MASDVSSTRFYFSLSLLKQTLRQATMTCAYRCAYTSTRCFQTSPCFPTPGADTARARKPDSRQVKHLRMRCANSSATTVAWPHRVELGVQGTAINMRPGHLRNHEGWITKAKVRSKVAHQGPAQSSPKTDGSCVAIGGTSSQRLKSLSLIPISMTRTHPWRRLFSYQETFMERLRCTKPDCTASSRIAPRTASAPALAQTLTGWRSPPH